MDKLLLKLNKGAQLASRVTHSQQYLPGQVKTETGRWLQDMEDLSSLLNHEGEIKDRRNKLEKEIELLKKERRAKQDEIKHWEVVLSKVENNDYHNIASFLT